MAERSVVLVHGGLYEQMGAERFWAVPGVVGGLRRRGLGVIAPDRLPTPRSWVEDAVHLASALVGAGAGPAVVVAGSNGCSSALRLALDHPGLVAALALCWPATPALVDVDEGLRAIIGACHGPAVPVSILASGVVRGVVATELAVLEIPVAVMAVEPENRFHQRATAEALLAAVANPVRLRPMPEPVVAGFSPGLFCDTIVEFVDALPAPRWPSS